MQLELKRDEMHIKKLKICSFEKEKEKSLEKM
jgi:hypothetical protein